MSRRADLDNPFWWLGLVTGFAFSWAALGIVLTVGFFQALIVLPAAGIALLCKNKQVALNAIRSLEWVGKAFGQH